MHLVARTSLVLVCNLGCTIATLSRHGLHHVRTNRHLSSPPELRWITLCPRLALPCETPQIARGSSARGRFQLRRTTRLHPSSRQPACLDRRIRRDTDRPWLRPPHSHIPPPRVPFCSVSSSARPGFLCNCPGPAPKSLLLLLPGCCCCSHSIPL